MNSKLSISHKPHNDLSTVSITPNEYLKSLRVNLKSMASITLAQIHPKVDPDIGKVKPNSKLTIESELYAHANSPFYGVNLRAYILYVYMWYRLKVDPDVTVCVYNT